MSDSEPVQPVRSAKRARSTSRAPKRTAPSESPAALPPGIDKADEKPEAAKLKRVPATWKSGNPLDVLAEAEREGRKADASAAKIAIAQRHPEMFHCEQCATMSTKGEPKWLSASDPGRSKRQHEALASHHSRVAAYENRHLDPTSQSNSIASLPSVATLPPDPAVAWRQWHWGLSMAGTTYNGGSHLMNHCRDYISNRPLPEEMKLIEKTTSRRTIRRKITSGIAMLASDLEEQIKDRFRGRPITLSFDGGHLSSTGAHIVCAIIHDLEAAYCLPVITTPDGMDGKAFNAKMMYEGLKKTLERLGCSFLQVRYMVSDAASVNGKTIESIAEEQAAAGGVELGALYRLAVEIDEDNDGDTVVQENAAAHEVAQQVSRDVQTVQHMKCVGHQIMLVVKQALKDKTVAWDTTEAAAFVRDINSFLAGVACRRARLRAALTTDRDAAIKHMRDTLKRHLDAHGEHITAADEESLIPEVACLRHGPLRAVARVFEGKTEVTDELLTAGMKACAEAEADAVPMRFSNATRWENSTFRCIEFALHNMDNIIDFAVADKGNKGERFCASGLRLAALAGETEAAKNTTIKTQLIDYITAFKPVAEFLRLFSDFTPLQGVRVFPELKTLEAKLVKLKAEEPRLVKYVSAIQRQLESRMKKEIRTGFWEAVSYLHPMAIRGLNEEKNAKKRETILHLLQHEFLVSIKSADSFRKAFDRYLVLAGECAWEKGKSSVAQFWNAYPDTISDPQKPESTKPDIFKQEALAALSVPPLVTLCDSVFSVETSLLTVRQARMTNANAIAYLLVRTNGPTFSFGHSSREEREALSAKPQ